MKFNRIICSGAAVLLMAVQSCQVSSRTRTGLVEGGKPVEVTKINVPMWMARPFLKSALSSQEDRDDIYPLLRQVSRVKLYSISGPQAETFGEVISPMGFEPWMQINSGSEKVNLMVRSQKGTITAVHLHVVSPGQWMRIEMKGKFSSDDINQAIALSRMRKEMTYPKSDTAQSSYAKEITPL